MSAGPLRTAFVAGLATVGAAIGPLTGNAVAQEAPQPMQVNALASSSRSPISQAVDFSEADRNNVAIMLYFGRGNKVTPEQVGQALIGRLNEAADRASYDVDAAYFYMNVDSFDGVAVDFAMGGVSIEGVDVREALARPSTEQPIVVTDRVIQKRIDVNQTLNMASLER